MTNLSTLLSTLIQPQQGLTIRQKFSRIVQAVVIYYALAVACTVLILVTDKFVLDIFHHTSISKTLVKNDTYLKETGIALGIFLISIEGPILEELVFRPALIPTRLNTALSLSFLTVLLSTILFSLNTPVKYLLTVVLSALIFLIVRYGPVPKLLAGFTVSQSGLLSITSVGFGLIHIFNFHPFYGELFFLYPIYVLPQIVMEFILGITRLRLGLIWSILLHILSNGLLVWHKLFI